MEYKRRFRPNDLLGAMGLGGVSMEDERPSCDTATEHSVHAVSIDLLRRPPIACGRDAVVVSLLHIAAFHSPLTASLPGNHRAPTR